jgi:hypothetical protein
MATETNFTLEPYGQQGDVNSFTEDGVEFEIQNLTKFRKKIEIKIKKI